ncbi:MAG TPA: HTH-type transcriptional repressor FabR [Pseudomonadales bacterium]|nr:HTH-type transcriptional repressor FabR [Pseudomonadales bacterium]
MTVRDERKLQTRQALMKAALDLMADNRGFAALSLREVTRAANVVPTAFYRHFRDMNELGQNLVDEAFVTLRRIMREVRSQMRQFDSLVRDSIEAYAQYVEQNRSIFAFVARERYGGVAEIRAAIAREIRFFINELADDLARFKQLNHLSRADRELISQLIVNIVVNMTGDLLDLDETVPVFHSELRDRVVQQIIIVSLGALQWKPDYSTRALNTENKSGLAEN